MKAKDLNVESSRPDRQLAVRGPAVSQCGLVGAVRKAVELEVPARPEMIGRLRSLIAEFARSLPFSEADIDDIKLAVGEAATNALRHGGSPGSCRIGIRAERHTDYVKICVWDTGCGFDPDGVGVCSTGSLAECGRGIILMRALMDEVKFTRSAPGMRVEMVKRLRDRPRPTVT